MTAAVDPSYRHPKCYANLHGGPDTKISGEHFVSHSLIKLYMSKNFVANVLCRNHNTELGVIDAAALQFATFVRHIALGFGNGAGQWGKRDEITVPGDDLERRALKLLCTQPRLSRPTTATSPVRSPRWRWTCFSGARPGRRNGDCVSRATRRTPIYRTTRSRKPNIPFTQPIGKSDAAERGDARSGDVWAVAIVVVGFRVSL
jgi:hypothetical protein